MKIALINENSQAAKNELIFQTLKSVVEPMGHEVVNYGMYSAEDDHPLTYVQNGILAAVLLNSGYFNILRMQSAMSSSLQSAKKGFVKWSPLKAPLTSS